MSSRLRALSVLPAVAVLAACGSAPDLAPPRGGDDPIVLIDHQPGLAPTAEEYALPDYVLLADGTAVTRAADQGIRLSGEVRRLAAGQVDELYDRARDAGLFRSKTYRRDDILDASALVVRITSDRGRYETAVVQPESEEGGARGRVGEFADQAPRIGEPTGAYQPGRFAVVVLAGGEDTADVRPWPLAAPATEMPGWPYRSCVILDGAELRSLLVATSTATVRTRWNAGGKTVSLLLRPLLPYEHDCDDL